MSSKKNNQIFNPFWKESESSFFPISFTKCLLVNVIHIYFLHILENNNVYKLFRHVNRLKFFLQNIYFHVVCAYLLFYVFAWWGKGRIMFVKLKNLHLRKQTHILFPILNGTILPVCKDVNEDFVILPDSINFSNILKKGFISY